MYKHISLLILLLIITMSPVSPVEISHDGMPVQVVPGDSAVTYITFLNRESVPSWVRISLSPIGPLSPENVLAVRKGEGGATAIGWTQVKQGWVEVAPQKIVKYPVQLLPPKKTVPDQYVVWLVMEQVTEKPKAMGEEQRGGRILETQVVDTYYLPVVINVSNERG